MFTRAAGGGSQSKRFAVRGLETAPQLLLAVLLVVTAALPAAVYATTVPGHGCQAPLRPPDDVPEPVWNGFLEAVDTYRACVSDYVARNNALADAHRRAANQATLAWNAFVRDSLNVPEDFPWPPDGEG